MRKRGDFEGCYLIVLEAPCADVETDFITQFVAVISVFFRCARFSMAFSQEVAFAANGVEKERMMKNNKHRLFPELVKVCSLFRYKTGMNELSRNCESQSRNIIQTAMLLMMALLCVEGCVLEEAEPESNERESTAGHVDVSDIQGSFSDGQNLARDEKDGEMILEPETSGIPNEFANCHYQGIPLWGEVEVVDAFPDIKVKIVDSFASIFFDHRQKSIYRCYGVTPVAQKIHPGYYLG